MPTPTTITTTLDAQRTYFAGGATRSLGWRIQQLQALKEIIRKNEEQILDALTADLGKPRTEGYLTEVSYLYGSIDHALKHLRRWARSRRVPTPLHLTGSGRIDYEPYGTVLIIAPFNYPFQLALEPLVGALAAGNTAIIKPSELTPTVAGVLQTVVEQAFTPQAVACIQGEVDTTTELLAQRFDYIFFTGSVPVGKIVMKAAAEYLTPVTLELGGKSPVIVDETASIRQAARRIAWGKFLNTGQTCIAPDYVLVHRSRKDELLAALRETITDFYGADARTSTSYGRIVNERHTRRLAEILDADAAHLAHGGQIDVGERYVEPTLLDLTGADGKSVLTAAVMEQEIFGPILPVLPYDTLDQATSLVRSFEKPLALYVFSRSTKNQKKITGSISSGGVSINDTLKHVSHPNLPFGGVGEAGIGAYHGRYSFETFSHRKGVYTNRLLWDLPVLFPPYTDSRLNLLKKVLG